MGRLNQPFVWGAATVVLAVTCGACTVAQPDLATIVDPNDEQDITVGSTVVSQLVSNAPESAEQCNAQEVANSLSSRYFKLPA